MTKSTAIVFILFFSILFRLERKVGIPCLSWLLRFSKSILKNYSLSAALVTNRNRSSNRSRPLPVHIPLNVVSLGGLPVGATGIGHLWPALDTGAAALTSVAAESATLTSDLVGPLRRLLARQQPPGVLAPDLRFRGRPLAAPRVRSGAVSTAAAASRTRPAVQPD